LTGRRDRALVATKVWSRDVAEGQRQIDRSLYYFDGRVDLYQVHNLVQWEAYLPVLERMKADGIVTAIGVTHYQHATFPEIERIVRSREIDAIQVPYNALDAACAHRLLPLAEERGIGVVVMRPFGEGALTAQRPSPAELRPFAPFGVTTWAQVLLKWVLSDRRVTVAIPATTREEHLDENAAAGSPPWFGRAERDEVCRLAQRYCS
jgi:diketogulonate reductase-like aldo/keto reductase